MMNLKKLFSKSSVEMNPQEMPEHIYCSVVRSLYADYQSLFVGILCMVAAPLVLFWKSGDVFQLAFCGLFLFFGMARILLAKSFFSSVSDDTTFNEYKIWEHRYFLSSCIYMVILGGWFMCGMYRSNDTFVHLLSLALTLSFMIGITGRNFGSDKLVASQVAIICFMIVGGIVAQGGVYNYLLAAFLIPFFVTIRTMATRLRTMLIDFVVVADTSKTIAERFNIALENVMHGIAMFNSEGKMVVANDRFKELAALTEWDVLQNQESLLEVDANSDKSELAVQLKERLEMCLSSRFRLKASGGKTIEVDFNSMNGGGVAVLADITDHVASEKVIRDLANFDALTNLPNRRHFGDEVLRVLGKDGKIAPCSMFFIDLDKFKEVNDTLGHGIGDRLLSVIASRLQLLIGSSGMICRFGGDEFVMVIPGMTTRDECEKLSNLIINSLQDPTMIDSHEISIGASVGIAVCPKDGESVEELLRNTDSALYEAKARGRGTYAFYTDELGEAIRLRRQLEIDLRHAIRDGLIEVNYQPLINLKRGRITTCEALARWDHPEHGMISPEKFVKLAEEAGSINLLGEYVLRQAIATCKTWPDHVRVAVNFSSVQFVTSSVADIVKQVLAEYDFPPNRLDIEVTETVMLENIEDATKTLRELSELGVRISLDDFGTGFSSLSYLHSLPFDKIKIDRSFIENGLANERSLTLLKGVVDLIKRLGLSVVLEGIETDKQMEVLSRSVDVNEVQGYLFSRPLPADDIGALLSSSLRNPESASGSKQVA